MKKLFLLISLPLFLFLINNTADAVTFYSQGLPDPTSLANWNTIRAGGGTTAPNYITDSNIFIIQFGYDVTINSSWGVAGNGAKLQIENGATLTANGIVGIGATAFFVMDSGAKYIHNNVGNFDTYILAGTEILAPNSTWEFQNWSGNSPFFSPDFGNLIYNSSTATVDFNWGGKLGVVQGNLELKNTNGKRIVFNNNGGFNITVGGDFINSGVNLVLTEGKGGFNDSHLDIYGNFNMTAGVINHTNDWIKSIISFCGVDKSISHTGGTINGGYLNWSVAEGSSYTLLSNFGISAGRAFVISGTFDAQSYNMTGAGNFWCNGVISKYITSHPQGVKGNLLNTGERYFQSHTIIWNGTANQNTGLSGLNISFAKAYINSNTIGIVTFDANLTITDFGFFRLDSNTTTDMGVFTFFYPYSGHAYVYGYVKTSNANGFSGAVNTTISNLIPENVILSGSTTVEYNSASAQLVSGRTNYHNLIFTGGGVKTFRDSVVVEGTINVNSGEIILMDTNDLKGIGTNALFAGTGTISLSDLTQITGFNNNFGGNFYVYGSNASIPSGIYEKLTIDGTAHLTGDVIVDELTIALGTLSVGPHGLVLSKPILVTPESLITDSTSNLVITGSTNFTIPSSVTHLGQLRINSTAPGGITAVSNINVHGIFYLSNGILHIGSHTFSADSINGGSSTKYVQMDSAGRLKKNNISGLTVYPIGNSSYNPLILNNTGGVADNFSVGLKDTITNPTPDNNQAVQREWNISEDVPGGSNVFLTLQWLTSEQGHSVNHTVLQIGHYTNGGYENILCNSVQGGNPWTITTSQPVSTFSPFIIANQGIAPVELASFSSAVNKNKVNLNWSTVMEENNSGFDIERRNETGEWKKISNVQGHGTSNNSHSYSFEDRNLQTGNYNYRLKQIDFNGNYMTGREVMQLVNEIMQAGYYTTRFDASKLSSGTYFYRIQTGDFSSIKKMVLVK